MIYILISVICSVSVGILFKLASRYKLDIQQAITANYLAAILLCIWFLQPNIQLSHFPSSPIYYVLGALLPGIFWILSRSVKTVGIARTDIAQRLSLVIPLMAAYFIFGEVFSVIKGLALAVAIAAVALILSEKSRVEVQKTTIYPALVFLGFGTVDILFKQVAADRSTPYTTSLVIVFCIAFTISLLVSLYGYYKKNRSFKMISITFGLLLGAFNFSNIFFYLKAHQVLAKQPSVVFASMNIGVVVLGSLIGMFIFHEKLSRLNKLGIALALLSIIVITVVQYSGY